MTKPLITIKNLKISKSDKILLDNLNFTIHQNDRVILVGQNGSGKTSLMKIQINLQYKLPMITQMDKL